MRLRYRARRLFLRCAVGPLPFGLNPGQNLRAFGKNGDGVFKMS